jgi:Phage tail sheath protein subtilisin-like domain
MPGLTQQSADVRFREIDLSQTLRNRSTANGAIVFVSRKGRPGRFNRTSFTEFVAEYGERDAAVSFGHYCAKDFFEEGNYLDCVRVLGSGYAWGAAILKDDGSGVTSLEGITGGLDDPDNISWLTYVTGGEIPLLMFYPKSGPGSYADSIRVRVTSENIDRPNVPVLVSANSGGNLIGGTYQYRVSAISEVGETLASTLATVTITGPISIARVTVSWTLVEGARGYKLYGRTSGAEGLIATLNSTTNTYEDLGLVTPDILQLPITAPIDLPPASREFTVSVFDTDINATIPQETWVCTLEDSVDGNGVQQEAVQLINAFSSYINVASYVPSIVGTPPFVKSTTTEVLIDGDSGTAPTNGQIAQAWIDEFADPERVFVNILINAGYTETNVQLTMLSLAASRGDAVAVLDVPSTMQDYDDAIAYRQLVLNANTSYGAIYTADLFESDNFNGKQLYVPPSGKVASVYARTDRVAGPQYAPAGLNRGLIDVLALRKEYNEAQRTQLFNAQINYIRRFIGAGTSVFEQVTLQNKASALSWVAVRRMINTIKGGVKDFLMYSLHEPNDDFLRRQIVVSLTEYLQFWKDARGLIDFQVIADDSNNPPAKYNLGILTVTIIITPVIAVHEIGVDIVITKAGVSFSEINIAALA